MTHHLESLLYIAYLHLCYLTFYLVILGLFVFFSHYLTSELFNVSPYQPYFPEIIHCSSTLSILQFQGKVEQSTQVLEILETPSYLQ